MSANKNARMKRRKEKLLQLQGGRCFWCGRQVTTDFEQKPGARPPENLATIDHLDSRYSPLRGKFNGLRMARTVLACWRCNNDRAKIREADLPIEELWLRSGRFPSQTEISAGAQ